MGTIYRPLREVVRKLHVNSDVGSLSMQTSQNRHIVVNGDMYVTEANVIDDLSNERGEFVSEYDSPDLLGDINGVELAIGKRTITMHFTIVVERASLDVFQHRSVLEFVGDLPNMVEL